MFKNKIGVEWQPNRAFEFVAMYVIADRTYIDSQNPVNDQAGNLLRLQMQVNLLLLKYNFFSLLKDRKSVIGLVLNLSGEEGTGLFIFLLKVHFVCVCNF